MLGVQVSKGLQSHAQRLGKAAGSIQERTSTWQCSLFYMDTRVSEWINIQAYSGSSLSPQLVIFAYRMEQRNLKVEIILRYFSLLSTTHKMIDFSSGPSCSSSCYATFPSLTSLSRFLASCTTIEPLSAKPQRLIFGDKLLHLHTALMPYPWSSVFRSEVNSCQLLKWKVQHKWLHWWVQRRKRHVATA
jgi:hypothetical protein